jgi:ribosomal protein L19
MNVIDKINKGEIERLKKEKNFDSIPLKSAVSVQYLTSNKDKRIFRGIVIAKHKKGITSNITITKTDANEGRRLTYKFLFFSPNLLSVTIDRLCLKKPRRAKLFYLESRCGKNARI